jgi:hypothetical protein
MSLIAQSTNTSVEQHWSIYAPFGEHGTYRIGIDTFHAGLGMRYALQQTETPGRGGWVDICSGMTYDQAVTLRAFVVDLVDQAEHAGPGMDDYGPYTIDGGCQGSVDLEYVSEDERVELDDLTGYVRTYVDQLEDQQVDQDDVRAALRTLDHIREHIDSVMSDLG